MNVNFHISRYQALMILIGVAFLLIVIKALTYLPEEQNDAQLMQNAKNKIIADYEYKQKEEADVQADDNVTSYEAPREQEEEDDETEKSKDASKTDTITNMLAEAEQLGSNNEYQKALSIYFDVVNITDDTQVYAVCYDGIAKIYAAQYKYDKALEKAHLAYRYDPTDMRKLTLVKLYHKLGNTAKEQLLLQELLEN